MVAPKAWWHCPKLAAQELLILSLYSLLCVRTLCCTYDLAPNSNVNHKDNILNCTGEMCQSILRRSPTRLTANSLCDTWQDGREWRHIMQVLKQKPTQTQNSVLCKALICIWRWNKGLPRQGAKLRNKNHIVISIDARKAPKKAQYPFFIKSLSKLGIFLCTIRTTWQPTNYIILNREKLEAVQQPKMCSNPNPNSNPNPKLQPNPNPSLVNQFSSESFSWNN